MKNCWARNARVALLILVCFMGQSLAEPPFCHAKSTPIIVGVSDGDTLVVEENGAKKFVQVFGVDAPEIGQPYAEEAAMLLDGIVSSNTCNLKLFEKNGIDTAEVFCVDPKTKVPTDLGCMLLQEGYAFLRNNTKEAKHINSQKMAKDRKAGVWAQEQVVSPWDYRRSKRLAEEEDAAKKQREQTLNSALGRVAAYKSANPCSGYGPEATLVCIWSMRGGSSGGSSINKSANGCVSDYDCGGLDMKCVKKPLSNTGVCLQQTDKYGTPQYSNHRSDSSLYNTKTEGSCKYNSDCPIGFVCDATYKQCVK